MKAIIVSILLFCSAAINSSASEFFVRSVKNGSIIYLSGEIVAGDVEKLYTAVRNFGGNILISLDSGGGSLDEGIALSLAIKKLEADVIVERGSICSSACSIIYLSGENRYIQRGASVKIHAPYRLYDKYSMPNSESTYLRSSSNIRTRMIITQIAKSSNVDQKVVDLMFRQLNPNVVTSIDISRGVELNFYTHVIE